MKGRQTLSVAVLTEDQDDVALVNSTLRNAGHAAYCHWVRRPNDIGKTLQSELVELMILNCDRFPESINRVVRQKDSHNPEIPVIALQAAADEAAIQSAMDEGACDLVSTSLKARLQSVVSRELRALRNERALNSTIQSAASYKKQLMEHMQSSSTAISLVEDGIITIANDAWKQLFRVASNDDVVGLPLMDNFETESHAAIKGALVAAVAGKWAVDEKLFAKSAISSEDSSDVHLEFRKFEFDNGPCVQIRISPPDESAPEPTKLVHEALQRDPTTLFYHRSQFIERVQKRLQKKPSSGLHALAYIRIDNFPDICQKIGYLNSDEVLKQVAEELRKHLQSRDIAGRFDGTAMAVLLERGSARDAEVWGQQFCKQIAEKTFDVDDHSMHLTCSVGVCAASDVFRSSEDLFSATISACQCGRKAGGNTVTASEAVKEETRLHEIDSIWARRLKSALMENRFRLAQLPIAGLRSDGVEMYDLFVRMLDEQGKSVLPSEFLPAAERSDMMKNIDRWMIKAAIEFCRDSRADHVFVRLSCQSVIDSSTVAWIEKEFEKHSFDGSRLIAQIPEADAAKHVKQTRSLVGDLRKLGAGFAIEHYGIDLERFRILDILKPDYIKIDGELMHSLMTDTSMQDSVRNIVAAAAERGIQSIAERVENANAMAVLFQLGLDFMQGHYVHEPEVVLEDIEPTGRTALADLAAANSS